MEKNTDIQDTNVSNKAIIDAHKPQTKNENEEAKENKSDEKHKESKTNRNLLFKAYCDETFTLVSLNEFYESLQAQKESLMKFHTDLENACIESNKKYASQNDVPLTTSKQDQTLLSDHVQPSFEKETPRKNQPSPTLALLALKHVVDRGRLNLQIDGTNEMPYHKRYSLFDRLHDAAFCAPLFLMPEVFGDDFSLSVPNNPTTKNMQLKYSNTPSNILRQTENITIADSKKIFTDKNHVKGHKAIPYIYLRQFNERTIIPINYQINQDKRPHNLLGRVEWALFSKMIQEHRDVVHHVSYEEPNKLAYFNQQAKHDEDLWIINKNAAEPLMARMELVAYFFNTYKHEKIKVPEHIEKSQSKIYLQLFKQNIIYQLYAEIVRLNANENNKTQAQRRTQYEALLQSIEDTLESVLWQHFKHIDDKTLTDEIHDVLNLYGVEADEYIKELQERMFDDDTLVNALHAKLCDVLREYAYDESNKVIASIVESLKTYYYEELSANFSALMVNNLDAAKEQLREQCKIEDKQGNESIARIIAHVLTEAEKIEHNESKKETPDYGQLTEELHEITTKLKMDNRFEAGQALCRYADRTHGHGSWRSRLLGGAMIALGAALMVGTLLATLLAFHSLGLSLPVAAGMASSSLFLLSTGVLIFNHGQQKSISHATTRLGKTLIYSYNQSKDVIDSEDTQPIKNKVLST